MILAITLLALCHFSFHLFATAHTFSWAEKAGGVGSDYGYSIAVDSDGNSYVTGSFVGTATFGATELTSSGSTDIFVAKLDASGAWQWATKAGGSSGDHAYGIAVTPSGTCYITGSFAGTISFAGLPSRTSNGGSDVLVAKLSTNGNWLWAAHGGGTGSDEGRSIGLDSEGNCYVTGYFVLNANFADTNLNSSGSDDIFVAKLGSSGSWLWASKAGSTGEDRGHGIAVGATGTCYITGYFSNTASFTVTNLTSSGSDDIFIAKINSSGTWQWAQKAGGGIRDRGESISIDSIENCYATGYFNGDATFGADDLSSAGWSDIFVVKLSSDGAWQWVESGGNANIELCQDIVADSAGNCYVTGMFDSNTDFGAHHLISAGNQDIFVAYIDNSGTWQWAVSAGGSYIEWGFGIDIDSASNCYVTGYFRGFNPISFGEHNLTANGLEDAFIAKLAPVYVFPLLLPILIQIEGEPFTITVIEGFGLNNAVIGVLPLINNTGAEYVSHWLSGNGISSFTIETTRPWGAAYFGGQWHAYERNGGTGLILFDEVDFGGAKGNIPIIMGDEDPTLPVELSSFTAILNADMQVNLQWVAESETDHAGYNVLRSEAGNLNTALRINPSPIIEGTHLGSQISYSYLDTETMLNLTYYYWLESLSLAGVSEYYGPLCLTLSDPGSDPGLPPIPLQTKLLKAYPNPFNPQVSIRYSLAEAASVRIEIYNFKGQKIKTLQNQHSVPGYYNLVWDGRDSNGSEVGSGVYLYRMNSGTYHATGKLSLIK